MSADSEPRSPREPAFDGQPTRALLLAQALETCIRTERALPGSADRLIAHQPAWARAELRRLVALAGSLDAVATNAVMSDGFRMAARARLMRRIASDGGSLELDGPMRNGHVASSNGRVMSAASYFGAQTVQRRGSTWLWRGTAGALLGVALLAAATLTASANALPGEPLYGVKQASEELGIRLAPDEQALTLVLLGQADTRLDETARLLQQGRTDQVAQTTQRYDDTLSRATTIVVTIVAASPDAPTSADVQSKLSDQQQQLQAMLATAPEPARSDIRQALVATERSQALVAGPRPTTTTPARGPSVAAPEAVPTSAVQVEVLPTEVPTEAPVVASVSLAVPPPVDVLSRDRESPVTVEPAPPEARVEHAVSPPAAVVAQPPHHAAPRRQELEPSDSDGKPVDAAPEEVRLPLAPPVVAESQPPAVGLADSHSSAVGAGSGSDAHDAHVAEPPPAAIARTSSQSAQDAHGDSAHADSTPQHATANVAQPARHTSKDSGDDNHSAAPAPAPARQLAPAPTGAAHARPTPAADARDDHHGAASTNGNGNGNGHADDTQSNSKGQGQGQNQGGHGH